MLCLFKDFCYRLVAVGHTLHTDAHSLSGSVEPKAVEGVVFCVEDTGGWLQWHDSSCDTNGVVFLDGALCVGISCLHDVLNDGVHIDLKVCVPAFLGVERIGGAISRIIGIKTIGRFPFVRHTVTIGVVVCGAAF